MKYDPKNNIQLEKTISAMKARADAIKQELMTLQSFIDLLEEERKIK